MTTARTPLTARQASGRIRATLKAAGVDAKVRVLHGADGALYSITGDKDGAHHALANAGLLPWQRSEWTLLYQDDAVEAVYNPAPTGKAPAGSGYAAQRAATVELLAAGRNFTAAELAIALGASASRAADILRELHTKGAVERSGRPFRYGIPVDAFDAWVAGQGEPTTVLVDGDEVVPSSDEERAELELLEATGATAGFTPAAVYGEDTFEEAPPAEAAALGMTERYAVNPDAPEEGHDWRKPEEDVEALFEAELERRSARRVATITVDATPAVEALDEAARRVDALEAMVDASKARRQAEELIGRHELEQDVTLELELIPGGRDVIGDEVLLGAGTELYVLEALDGDHPLEVRVRLDRDGMTRYGRVPVVELRRAIESPRIGQPARRFGPHELLELERPLEGHRIDETKRHQYAGLAEARITRLPAGIEVELLELAPGTPPAAKVVTYAITTSNRDRTVLLVRLAELEAAVGATFEAPTPAECAR